jgi:DNA-binding transcriptional ArsR family regulator
MSEQPVSGRPVSGRPLSGRPARGQPVEERSAVGRPEESDTPAGMPSRRRPTAAEAKALAHPLRLRILMEAAQRELTNKQLAEILGATPGTVLFHVRVLVKAGLLTPAAVRTGESGALEKPYTASGLSWWLDDALGGSRPDIRTAPVRMFLDEVARADAHDLASYATFSLHLSEEDVAELDRQLLAVVDSWITSDADRRDRPVHRAMIGFLRRRDEAF